MENNVLDNDLIEIENNILENELSSILDEKMGKFTCFDENISQLGAIKIRGLDEKVEEITENTDNVKLSEEDILASKEREEELKRSLSVLANLLDVTLDNLTILEKTKNSFMETQEDIQRKYIKFGLEEFKVFSDDLLERKIKDEYTAIENVKRDIFGINFSNITFEDYDYYLTTFEEYTSMLDADNECINVLIKKISMQKEYLEDKLFDGIRNKLCELVRKMTVENLENELDKYSTKDTIIDKIFKRDKLKEEIRKNIKLKIKMAFNLDNLIEVYTIEDVAKYIKNLSNYTDEIESFAKTIEDIYGISCIKRRRNVDILVREDAYRIKYFGNREEFMRIAKENSKMKLELGKNIQNVIEEHEGYLEEIKYSIINLKMPGTLENNLEVILEKME